MRILGRTGRNHLSIIVADWQRLDDEVEENRADRSVRAT